ncbi:MAG: hypothetical protein LC792_11295 [Actinobacteria bacterium]|nr:hypothetical protein [Actinomycetota bacterium]
MSDEDEFDMELTAEERVAVDTAMLLDLGDAEALADLIARQSLGEPDSVADARAPGDRPTEDPGEAPGAEGRGKQRDRSGVQPTGR